MSLRRFLVSKIPSHESSTQLSDTEAIHARKVLRLKTGDLVEALDGKMPLYAGLYLPDLQKPESLRVAIEDSLASGAAGVSLFGDVSEEHWEAFGTKS